MESKIFVKTFSVLLTISLLFICGCKSSGSISGGAWVTKGGGQSDILRGIEVALCKGSTKEMIEKERDVKIAAEVAIVKQDSPDIEPLAYMEYNRYDLLPLKEMNEVAAKNAIKVVKTNIDGKYLFEEVPYGYYILYAYCESSFSKIYWLIPIKVASRKTINMDFDNSNAEEVLNKHTNY